MLASRSDGSCCSVEKEKASRSFSAFGNSKAKGHKVVTRIPTKQMSMIELAAMCVLRLLMLMNFVKSVVFYVRSVKRLQTPVND